MPWTSSSTGPSPAAVYATSRPWILTAFISGADMPAEYPQIPTLG